MSINLFRRYDWRIRLEFPQCMLVCLCMCVHVPCEESCGMLPPAKQQTHVALRSLRDHDTRRPLLFYGVSHPGPITIHPGRSLWTGVSIFDGLENRTVVVFPPFMLRFTNTHTHTLLHPIVEYKLAQCPSNSITAQVRSAMCVTLSKNSPCVSRVQPPGRRKYRQEITHVLAERPLLVPPSPGEQSCWGWEQKRAPQKSPEKPPW